MSTLWVLRLAKKNDKNDRNNKFYQIQLQLICNKIDFSDLEKKNKSTSLRLICIENQVNFGK